MGTFAQARLSALRVPINGPVGRGFASALGGAQDDEAALLRLAGLLRDLSRAPDEALDDLGTSYGIERLEGESDASYRARLEVAWETYALAGAPEALIESLEAYGIPDVLVLRDEAGQFGPGPSGNWYSGFWVGLGPDFGTTGIGPLILGSFTLGGMTLGSTATRHQILAIKRQILRWKAAHGYPVRVLLFFGSGGPILGVGIAGGARPLILGSFTLGGTTAISWVIGRTLNDTMPTLGSAGFILGGYEL